MYFYYNLNYLTIFWVLQTWGHRLARSPRFRLLKVYGYIRELTLDIVASSCMPTLNRKQ